MFKNKYLQKMLGWCPRADPGQVVLFQSISQMPSWCAPFVGAVLLMSLATIRSFVWYNYVPGIINIWHWTLTYLIILPTDGLVAELYGFWSEKKSIAFLIGFLPSVVAMIVASIRLVSLSSFFIYLLLGLGMGTMGFGGAEYKAERKPAWLFAGFIVWLLILLMAIWSGMN